MSGGGGSTKDVLEDSSGTELATATNPLRIDPTGSTTQPISGTVTITDVATATNQTTQITSLQLIDDVPTSQNGSLVKGNPIMGQLDDVSTTAATENNCAAVRITAQRATHTNLRNNAGTEIGTSSDPVRVDPTGSTIQPVSGTVSAIPLDGTKATYSASATDIAMAATPTDVFTITGSATKTIRVLRISVSGTLTTGAVRDVLLIKRSTANSGGTSASATAVAHDSNDAAATATVLSYTANPTLGTTVGAVRTAAVEIPAANLSGAVSPLVWTFGDRPGKAVVLRGTSQVLAVNFGATTAAGNDMEFDVEWTEES